MALCMHLEKNKSVFLHTSKGEKIKVKNYGSNNALLRIDAPETIAVLREDLTDDQRKRYLDRSLRALRCSLVALLFSLFAFCAVAERVEAQTLTLTSPNGGETWPAGESRDVRWTSTGTFANVRIEISVDGGATFPTVLASGTANDGSKGVTIPNTPSTNCRVRITGSTGSPTDISNNNFTITGTTTPPPAVRDSLWLIAPNGGEKLEAGTQANITFGKQGSLGSVRLEFSDDNGFSWQFVGITPNQNFVWTVPQFISPVCALRISDANDGIPSDYSDRVFSIVAPVQRGKLIVIWNPNIEADLAGYWVYFGTKPRAEENYSSAFFTSDTTFTIDNLLPASYFIAVTAIDNSGNESGFSKEVSAMIEPEATDTMPPQVPAGVNVRKE